MDQPKLDHLPQMPADHLAAYRSAGFRPVAITSRTAAAAQGVAHRHAIPRVHRSVEDLVRDPAVEVVDVAVPPDVQPDVIRRVVAAGNGIRGILAQKPLAASYSEARELVELCEREGVVLGVNQNMRYDQSVRAAKSALDQGLLGQPVLASIDMRAIPHWMPWQQRQGWVTLRVMSIHHLDTFRYWLGTPDRVFASVRPDPRTAARFRHTDGICLYILEYDNGIRATSIDDVWTGPALEGAEADVGIRWRLEGTDGLARGTIGWPDYPERTPSTIDVTSTQYAGWLSPRWDEVWFSDAFAGTMAQLLCAIERGAEPEISGRDNLETMALVDACYKSADEGRAVAVREIIDG